MLVALCNYVFGKYFSVIAMAFGYLGVNIIILPLIVLVWWRCKKKWHKEEYVEAVVLDKALMLNESLSS